MKSKILEDVLANRNRTINLKVVFLDVCSYSKRRSLTQAEVVDSFMAALKAALTETSQLYVKYAQDNDLNFQNDIICLPAGDGAAIVFPFDGLHDIHLQFARQILKKVYEHNKKNECEKFENNGWCNCHSNFNLTVGISEGKGILYKDINNNYNVAGNAINIAARVMNIAEKNQIFMSEEAYKQLVDLVDDANLDEKFKQFQDVQIKHGLKINVYQYIYDEDIFINCDTPEHLEMSEKTKILMSNMRKAGFPIPDLDDIDKNKAMGMIKQMSSLFVNPINQAGELKITDSIIDNTGFSKE